jgi:hypothetical protein
LEVFVRRPPESAAPFACGRHPKTFTGADMRLVFITKSAHTNIVEGMAGPRGLA